MTEGRRPSTKHWVTAMVVATVGVIWQYSALSPIKRDYPAVSDVLMDNLPRIDVGYFGELWFFGLILLFAVPHYKNNCRRTPGVLTAFGLMYFICGWTMSFFPIGVPVGAVEAAERLASGGRRISYLFPGSDIAILTALTILIITSGLRKFLWAGLSVFGNGALLSKNRYTADSMVGSMLGYTRIQFVRRFILQVQ